jgi:hypothetical protein
MPDRRAQPPDKGLSPDHSGTGEWWSVPPLTAVPDCVWARFTAAQPTKPNDSTTPIRVIKPIATFVICSSNNVQCSTPMSIPPLSPIRPTPDKEQVAYQHLYTMTYAEFPLVYVGNSNTSKGISRQSCSPVLARGV